MPGSYRNRRLPSFRRGQQLKAEDLNDLVEAVDSLRRAGSAGGLSRGTYGGVVYVGAPAGELRRVRAPVGGIPARSGATPGSATCTLCTYDGTTWAVGTETLLVKNDYATAVEALKLLWVTFWSGAWWVVTESCA